MKVPMWCLLVLFVCSCTQEVVVDKTRPSRWQSYQTKNGRIIFRNLKRHSEGTFTNDFTGYLDKIKAKDFVEWLATVKRQRCCEDLLQIAAEV